MLTGDGIHYSSANMAAGKRNGEEKVKYDEEAQNCELWPGYGGGSMCRFYTTTLLRAHARVQG